MPELDLQTISAVAAVVGVIVGVVLTFLELRHLRKERQTDLIMRLYSIFSSREFQDAWAKVRASNLDGIEDGHAFYDYDQKHGLAEVNEVCLFFEGIGILLHRKLADTTMIEDLFGGAIARAWEKVKTGIIVARKQFKDPSIYWYFEYLYDEMKKKEQKLKSPA